MIVKIFRNRASKLCHKTLKSGRLHRLGSNVYQGGMLSALCLADIFDNKLSDNRLSTGSNLASETQEFFFKKLFSSIFTIEKIVIFAFKHVF